MLEKGQMADNPARDSRARPHPAHDRRHHAHPHPHSHASPPGAGASTGAGGGEAQAGLGHNSARDAAAHLHSHVGSPDEAADLAALAAGFIEGFVKAGDKASYLRLARIPSELPSPAGPALKLVDIEIRTNWQVATASPGFASRELVYLPLPGERIAGRTNLTFIYVSLLERRDLDLRHFLAQNKAALGMTGGKEEA